MAGNNHVSPNGLTRVYILDFNSVEDQWPHYFQRRQLGGRRDQKWVWRCLRYHRAQNIDIKNPTWLIRQFLQLHIPDSQACRDRLVTLQAISKCGHGWAGMCHEVVAWISECVCDIYNESVRPMDLSSATEDLFGTEDSQSAGFLKAKNFDGNNVGHEYTSDYGLIHSKCWLKSTWLPWSQFRREIFAFQIYNKW